MVFRFSIIDDDTDLILGYCNDVIGLAGDNQLIINDYITHKITLVGFKYNYENEQYYRTSRNQIGNLRITVIDKDSKPIGSYYYSLDKPISYYNKGFDDGTFTIELKGVLDYIASKEALKLWDIWRNSRPMVKNQWASLSEEERRGWLEIVRLYRCEVTPAIDRTKENIYYIDGSYITDYSSFFCAFGEAVNGPGGYCGDSFSSLEDCFYGGFGLNVPFTLVWTKPFIAIEKLNWKALANQVLLQEGELLEGNNSPSELKERSLFLEILKFFADKNIVIILDSKN